MFSYSIDERNISQTVLLSFISVFIFSMPSNVIIVTVYVLWHKFGAFSELILTLA